MGQILSQPVIDKHSESGSDDRLIFGLSSMQGWRVSMEDAHATILDLKSSDSKNSNVGKVSYFGVYDGHGGDRVALFTGENLHNIVARQEGFEIGEFGQALKDGFLSTDRAILQDASFKTDPSGCTATTAIVTDKKIIVANAGDSRTVLGVKGIAKPLSFDHKPQNEGERARICAAGGFVEVGRVNGNLALSRAIGDFDFKKSANLPPEEQIVTAYPDVLEHEITPDDEFIVLACDGIWDCMHSQAVVEFVRRGIAEKQTLQDICENLMDNCLAPSSDMSGIGCDNMTVLIVGLLNGQTEEEWYETISKRVANGEGPAAPVSSAEMKGNPFTGMQGQNHLELNNSLPQIGGGISIQQLLGGNATLTNENGMYVIQANSSILSSIGLVQGDDVEDENGNARIIEDAASPEVIESTVDEDSKVTTAD